MTGPVDVSATDLATAATLLVVHGALSAWLGLGLHGKIFIAAIRAVVQLTLLGWLLVPVMEARSPWIVLALAAVMVMVGALEANRRVSRRYRGMYLTSLVTLAVAAGSTTVLATGALLHVDPWWEPRYLVPILGMILGNALTGIGIGLDRALTDLDTQRHTVELLLARGATWWEASRHVAAEAIRSGLVPILNTMTVVGIVSIPGMMTGQILGGTDPQLAARYQLLIIFLIAGATALGTAVAVLFAVGFQFDADQRLRLDRLETRPS